MAGNTSCELDVSQIYSFKPIGIITDLMIFAKVIFLGREWLDEIPIPGQALG
jgi:hypothetical protein